MQSLAKNFHQSPNLPLRNRFEVLKDEPVGMTSDDIIDHEDRKPPAAKTALDRHRTLRSSNDNEDEANQDSEREIGNLRVNHTETEHELLRFIGKLAGKNAVFLVDSGSTHDFIAQNFVERHNLEGTCSEE